MVIGQLCLEAYLSKRGNLYAPYKPFNFIFLVDKHLNGVLNVRAKHIFYYTFGKYLPLYFYLIFRNSSANPIANTMNYSMLHFWGLFTHLDVRVQNSAVKAVTPGGDY